MRVSSDRRPLSKQEDELLDAVIDDLVERFGLGPVKQETNRRPKPKDNGHPRVWDHTRLFSLWLIVQAWALREHLKILPTCRLLEERTGGLTMYAECGDAIVLKTSKQILKQFNKAATALK